MAGFEPGTVFDQQRGFVVCAEHSPIREHQTNNQPMSKAKLPPSTDGAAASAAADQKPLRSNPEIDAKIDGYIKENPKYWAYVQDLPRERLERMLVLNEIQKLDRQQRVRDNVLKQ